MGTEPVEYCREIETYLCRKNDGHLIRVVGPSFDLVSRWASQGVPLKIAFRGIDRYFERYYRRGPRRRPVRIDFCEADVLDVFDEWRRAVGLPGVAAPDVEAGDAEHAADAATAPPAPVRGHGTSLPAHLQRAIERLTSARAIGVLGPDADALIDGMSAELDAARAASRGLRGEARQALLARLGELDQELLAIARTALAPDAVAAIEREAHDDLAGYRQRMTPEAYRRAHRAAADRLVRARFGLPTLTL